MGKCSFSEVKKLADWLKPFPEKFKPRFNMDCVKPAHAEDLSQMSFLGKLSFNTVRKTKPRLNDPEFVELMRKYKIDFAQTHKMNEPNNVAAYGAVARFPKPVPMPDEKAWNTAWLWVEALLHPHWKNSKILTYDEVLSKTSDIEFKNKASGIPFNTVHHDKEQTYADAFAREYIESEWNNLLRSETTFSQVTVKKEILPLKKLEENRLRNVMAVAADHNMWAQMLTFDMNHKLNAVPLKAMCALGWSPFGGGMHHLASYLGKFPCGWDLDGGSWESKIFTEALMRIANLRFHALAPEYQTQQNLVRFENLYKMIASCPLVMPDGYVFLKGEDGRGGNLTGQVGTAHDNTIFMMAVFCYCFIRIFGDDFLFFQLNTRVACFGDDCTFTVSQTLNDMAGNYGVAMADVAWSELGVIFECPSWQPRPFHELSFLSLWFKFDNEHHRWVQVVNRDKMYSSLLQGGTERDAAEQMQRICSMRNVTWGDVKVRKELALMINAFEELHDQELAGDLAWEISKTNHLSDKELATVYYGYN